MTTIEEFAAGFCEEPGYLDYANVGPLSVPAGRGRGIVRRDAAGPCG